MTNVMSYLEDAFKALFTRNTTNAASVSGARVPFVEQNGAPIGNDSIANFASVLGGVVTPITQNTDLNNITQVGLYYIASGSIASTIVNFPDPSNKNAGILLVMPAHAPDTHRYQLYFTFSTNNCAVYCRIKNANGVIADSG